MEKNNNGNKKRWRYWIVCGSEGKDKITGWICDFYYSLGLKTIISRDSDLDNEVLEVPIEIIEIESNKKIIGLISAGIRDLKQDPNAFIVEPIVNYCFSYDNHLPCKFFDWKR